MRQQQQIIDLGRHSITMCADDQPKSFVIKAVQQLYHLNLFERVHTGLHLIIEYKIYLVGVCQRFHYRHYFIDHRGCHKNRNFPVLIIRRIHSRFALFADPAVDQMLKYKIC